MASQFFYKANQKPFAWVSHSVAGHETACCTVNDHA
jgi:hypothetical protein